AENGTMGGAACGVVDRDGGASAGVGAARARRLVVGVGVLGPGVRRAAPAQGGPGARRQPAAAGGARGVPGGAAAGAHPRRADQGDALTGSQAGAYRQGGQLLRKKTAAAPERTPGGAVERPGRCGLTDRAVIIAAGVAWRRLGVAALEPGRGSVWGSAGRNSHRRLAAARPACSFPVVAVC